ncbi:G-type lectin S-receptor-like serine/threonine-protein kinase At2g19130 [Cryptomeria japonica]|uniref:G-type lectin S-receptor-like serine/threonine-protein kinase At2g19130 n=1 Tax=Cryptomeria japonica TaxID=3369 RepID=UPI0027DA2B45|nr:G-type lectin S-receptor-like serine/threonine-protein kinase At2g19130 [Cryptomeria japonica]
MQKKCRDFHLHWVLATIFAVLVRADDTIDLGPGLTGDQTIASQNGQFELGFFSPGSNNKWYIGIWYAQITPRTVVWVANREQPVSSFAALKFTENGTLAVLEANNNPVWETGNLLRASRAVILDSGNLVLLADDSSNRNDSKKGKKHASDIVVWESFDNPADTWLPGMKISYGKLLTSWKTLTNPAPGDFSLRLNLEESGSNSGKFSEFQLVWRNSFPYWSSGKWIGNSFMFIPEMTVKYIYNFSFVNPNSSDGYFTYTVLPQSNVMSRFAVDNFGKIKQYTWTNQANAWNMFWQEPRGNCKVYGLCGPNGVCDDSENVTNSDFCKCVGGFKSRFPQAWDSQDWSGGCVRSSPLQCKTDTFYEFGNVDLDKDNINSVLISGGVSVDSCRRSCLDNCSCIGYAYREGFKECRMLWGDLWNLRNCSADDDNDSGTTSDSTCTRNSALVYVRIAACDLPKKDFPKRKVSPGVLIGALSGFGAFTIIVFLNFLCWKHWKKAKNTAESFHGTTLTMFTYKDLQIATRNFSEKLGSGGFGSVYKGVLSGSIPIAVKKLERPEGGEKQFRMEVSTIGTIQHVNLVRLRGFCSEGDRRLLVYDYMPNGSLNTFLFKEQQNILGWDTRYRIALGTARALAYLHEECRDCIIHCDIKPENILLDADFNAKVSDFGLAKLVGRDFSRVLTTMRGTRGYLAPEWISGLPITAKADVYSFGMTLLEIIGGRRNIETSNVESEKWFFPPWAAKQVSVGNILELVDNHLAMGIDEEEVRRAAMVAIWCIQDDEDSRPTMGTIVKMLEGILDVSTPPIPRTLQALMDENRVSQTMTVDSEMDSPVSSPSSIVVVNASKDLESS